eukprot:6286214-Prymnesium_polylepis.1
MRTPATRAPQHGLVLGLATPSEGAFSPHQGSPSVQQGGFSQPTPTFTRLVRGCAPDTDAARRTCAIADESVTQSDLCAHCCMALTLQRRLKFSSVARCYAPTCWLCHVPVVCRAAEVNCR